jgi:hypothetical protein
VFFSQSADNTPFAGLAGAQLNVSTSFGAAAQIGFGYMLDRHWGLNFDVKKLYLEPNHPATVNGAIPVSGTAQINPWSVAGAASPTSSDALPAPFPAGGWKRDARIKAAFPKVGSPALLA